MSILEHPGLRRSCVMLSFPMAFAIRTERSKKCYLCLIPACCNESRFFPNHFCINLLVIPDSCQRKNAFQASPHDEQQVKYLNSWKEFWLGCLFSLSARDPRDAAEGQGEEAAAVSLCRGWWQRRGALKDRGRVCSLLLLVENGCFPCLSCMGS